MSEYTIEGKVAEQSLTYLTHKSTKKEYLLREQTFNDLREFAQSSDRLKKRSCIRDPHLTNLARTLHEIQALRRGPRIISAPIFTRSIRCGNSPTSHWPMR
jgi:hypothetical protein